MFAITLSSLRPTLATAALLLLIAACREPAAGPSAPPPPEVGVVRLATAPLRISTELPGRTVAYRIADVRPQVGGVVLKRLFNEGASVKAGQPLYQIDPAPLKATLASAEAALARAQASASVARRVVERYQGLVEVNAVSRQEFDDAGAALQTAEADVGAARAQVDSARINLRFAQVLAPISGRAGRSNVTEGALVTAGQATALVTIQQLDPIYVDVTQPSVSLLKLRRQLASGELTRVDGDAVASRLRLEDGSDYPAAGRLQFSEVTVAPDTGSVTLRAIFPNADGLLLPGMFVHASIDEGLRDAALLVPQQAVTRNQRGEPTALIVDDEGKAQLRTLQTERAIGTDWLVSAGLSAGDRVIVEGVQKVRPGAPVTVRDVSRDALQAVPVAGRTPAAG